MARNNEEELGVLELDENLADVEKPPEVPPGVYTGEIQSVDRAMSDRGNDIFKVRFVIPADELPADIQEHYEDGAIFFWNRLLVPSKAAGRRSFYNMRKWIEAIGLDSNTTTIDPNEWMGQSARLRIVHGTYQGETRAEIRAVEAAEAEAPARGRGGAPARGAAARGRAAPEPDDEETEVATPPARGRGAAKPAPARGRGR